MRSLFGGVIAGSALAGLLTAADAAGPAGRGAAVYAERCSGCHDAGAARAPSKGDLTRLTSGEIEEALLTGSMAGMAFGLGRGDVEAVAAYLAGGGAAERAVSPPPAAPRRSP